MVAIQPVQSAKIPSSPIKFQQKSDQNFYGFVWKTKVRSLQLGGKNPNIFCPWVFVKYPDFGSSGPCRKVLASIHKMFGLFAQNNVRNFGSLLLSYFVELFLWFVSTRPKLKYSFFVVLLVTYCRHTFGPWQHRPVCLEKRQYRPRRRP